MTTIAQAFFMLMLCSIPFAWITHIIKCISDDSWGFLIAGAIMFPVAVIHGWGIWFGAF